MNELVWWLIFNINTILNFGAIWINFHSENSLKIIVGSKQQGILATFILQDLNMFSEASSWYSQKVAALLRMWIKDLSN